MLELYTLSPELLTRRLAKISDPHARNLVAQMLTKLASRRPTIEQVLLHPFLTGVKAARMVGEEAEFDVFISYRVSSDSQHASLLYDLLTAAGLHVWLDRLCLEPGVSWEEGFCDGLVKSRIFLPILSRGAINHADKAWQNFSQLTAESRCDNVLLEHLLALELQARGLVEKIYPVMIGDLVTDCEAAGNCSIPSARDDDDEDDTTKKCTKPTLRHTVYENYFATGCHPLLPPEDNSVIVASVATVLHTHLSRLALGTPMLEGMTVARIVNSITRNQGSIVTGPAATAFDKIVADNVRMSKC